MNSASPIATSSVAPSLAGSMTSSAPKDTQQIVTESLLASNQYRSTASAKNWFKENGLHIFGWILAGVVGWFSAVFTVKSDIASAQKDIAIVKTEMTYVQKDLSDVKTDVKALNGLSQDIAVIKARLDLQSPQRVISTENSPGQTSSKK